MEKLRMFTRQHESVWEKLERDGRYTARREYLVLDAGPEHEALVLEAYDWLARRHPQAARRPPDADYPVWLSYSEAATLCPAPGQVILELELDPALVTPVNIAKWGAILNYAYIPADEADARRHKKLLADFGVADAQAFMSRFYPELKREIMDSWDRLFDDGVLLGNDYAYGTVWELRREWVRAARAYSAPT